MANHEIIENNYSEVLRMLEPSDPAHADTFNHLFERLINNDVFLKNLTERLIGEHEEENATTSKKGHVRLNDSTSSTSTTLAATANAIRKAYERAEEVDSMQVNMISRTGMSPDSLPEDFPRGYSVIGETRNTNVQDWIASVGEVRRDGYRILVETHIATPHNNNYTVHKQRVTYFTSNINRGLISIHERYSVSKSYLDGERSSWGPWVK